MVRAKERSLLTVDPGGNFSLQMVVNRKKKKWPMETAADVEIIRFPHQLGKAFGFPTVTTGPGGGSFFQFPGDCYPP